MSNYNVEWFLLIIYALVVEFRTKDTIHTHQSQNPSNWPGVI
jgi:hypothetical protein